MERCLSIDFGNSFTKLALRPRRGGESNYLRNAELDLDRGLNICVPTLAARLGYEDEARWFFGIEALDVPAFAPQSTFFRDWKHDFFLDAESNLKAGRAVERRGRGSEWRRTTTPDEVDVIARGYFRWLREFIDESLEASGQAVLDAETVVRISIPSFVLNTQSEVVLLEILRNCGFEMDPAQPTLPEPLANAIGVFSEGRNVMRPEGGVVREELDLDMMFAGTRLMETVRSRSLGVSAPRMFWTLVADLGAYTLDFAMIGFSTGNLQRSLMDTFYGKERFALHSEPLGMADLYRSIRDQLYPGKRGVFDQIIEGRVPEVLAPFLDNLFHHKIPFEYRNTGMVFGEPEEAPRIAEAVDEFAEDVASRLRHFMKHFGYRRVDEVIMTGGGMNLPEVRNALFEVAQRYEANHAFVPAHPEEALNPAVFDAMDPFQVRGATALGGASVFFDEAVEILNS